MKRWALVLVVALVMTPLAAGQQRPVFRSGTELVLVNVVVRDKTGAVVRGLTRNVTWGRTHGLSIQLLANNVFNTVQFGSIDTVVNSPTFGQVTAVRPMRRVQVLARLRI